MQSVIKNGSLDLGHIVNWDKNVRTFLRTYLHLFSESLEDPPDEAPPPPPPQESSESETDDVETVIDAEEKQDVNSVQDIPNGKPDEKEPNLDKAFAISSKSKFHLFTICNCKCMSRFSNLVKHFTN